MADEIFWHKTKMSASFITLICVIMFTGVVAGSHDQGVNTNALKAAKEFLETQRQIEENADTTQGLLKTLTKKFRPGSFIDDYVSHAEEILAEELSLSITNNTNITVSEECVNDMLLVFNGLLNTSSWALQMIDAMGKPGSDIAGGNLHWLGGYDECFAINVKINGSADPFDTKYCSLAFPIGPQPAQQELGFTGIQLSIGLCVPSSCSSKDINNLVIEGILMLPINTTSIPNPKTICPVQSPPLDTKAKVTIGICSIFAAVIVIATAYDVIVMQCSIVDKVKDEKAIADRYSTLPHEDGLENGDVSGPEIDQPSVSERIPPSPGLGVGILLAFSVYTNGKRLLSTSQPAGSLSAVHGIRFLSMSWVLLGHTIAFTVFTADNAITFTPKVINRFSFQVIANGTFSVDSFFLLSGLLVAYLALRQMEKTGYGGKFGWGKFYFHRYWRLTPPYMLFLMVYVTLWKYLANGPMWLSQGLEKNDCSDSWWKNILYVNNLGGDQCMGWSWYLANDMQFYVLSPLMLIPLFISPILGSAVCIGFLLICFLTNGILATIHSYPANQLSMGIGNQDFMDVLYFKPYARIGPYVIGILTGYILHKTNCKIRIPKVLNLLGWATATGVALSVIYGLYVIDGNNLLDNRNVHVNAFYIAVSRTAWGMALAWVVFACATGHGGFVNTLLSWKPFIPLGRLSYCVYLVHPAIIFYYILSRRVSVNLDDLENVYLFLGNLVMSYMVAFVVSLAFESPMMALEKAIISRKKSS